MLHRRDVLQINSLDCVVTLQSDKKIYLVKLQYLTKRNNKIILYIKICVFAR